MQRIAWSTENDVIHRILKSVGLATDGPMPHTARSAEELFGQAPAV